MKDLIWKTGGHLGVFLLEVVWRLSCCAVFLVMAIASLVCPSIVGGVLGKVVAEMLEE